MKCRRNKKTHTHTHITHHYTRLTVAGGPNELSLTFHHQPEAKFNGEFSSPWLRRALTATFFLSREAEKIELQTSHDSHGCLFRFLLAKGLGTCGINMWNKNMVQQHQSGGQAQRCDFFKWSLVDLRPQGGYCLEVSWF